MAEQLSMLDLMRGQPTLVPVDPDGSVVKGDIDEVWRLPHPRLAWALAEIELHRHTDGRWMWAVKHCSGGYRVGPKWGKFADSRDDALHYAVQELLTRVENMIARPEGYAVTVAQLRQIMTWAEGLR